MSSSTEIANLAISHLGVGKEIANLSSDKGQEAAACRRYYEKARKITLKAMDWPFATAFATLNLIELNPSNEWTHSYRYPSSCLLLRRILSGARSDTLGSRVPFKILKDETGLLIYTGQESAEVEFTENITDTKYFSDEFEVALSFQLSYYIAPRITSGDPFKIKQDMMAQFEQEILRIMGNNNKGKIFLI